MKDILKDDKSYLFIVGVALVIPVIIGLVYVLTSIYI